MDKPTPEIAALKRLAAGRAPQLNLPYAGALLPREAHQLMQAGVRLVDVRTRAELDWVGRIPGALPIEWSGYPGNTLNPGFLEELADFVDKDEPVMFVCRSAGRSHHAAVAATGPPISMPVTTRWSGNQRSRRLPASPAGPRDISRSLL